MTIMSKLLWYVGVGCLAGAGIGAALLLASQGREDGSGAEPGPGTPGGGVGALCPPVGARILLLGDS
jgi:hypothetical protein